MDNPYQAPTAAVRTGPATLFKDPATLTLASRVCLVTGACISLAAIVISLWEYGLLESAAPGELDNVYERVMWPLLLVGLPQLLVTLASFVVIGMWIYRVAGNARGFAGARNMEFTPRWSVGWYFVPFANLWKPYQAMKEIWKASAEPARMETVGVTAWMPAWWTLWIVGNLLGNFSFRLALEADTVESEIQATIATIASDAINVPLCLVFLVIVNRVARMQQQQHDVRRHAAVAS